MLPSIEVFESRYIPEPNSGCWIWLGPTFQKRGRSLGYGRFGHNGNLAHRVSYSIYCGPIPEGAHVCHKCDNVLCVNPDHLFLGNNRINTDDKVAKNRHLRGEQIFLSKLTEAEVREIKKLTGSNSSIATKYNVSPACIWTIRTKKAWAWVTDD